MLCAHASAAAVSRVRDTLPLRQWFSSTPARWGCGSCTGQEHIFTVVAEPLLSDVLEGYNSTILAYGQVPASRVPQTVPNTTPPHKPIYSLSFSKTQLRHPHPPSPPGVATGTNGHKRDVRLFSEKHTLCARRGAPGGDWSSATWRWAHPRGAAAAEDRARHLPRVQGRGVVLAAVRCCPRHPPSPES